MDTIKDIAYWIETILKWLVTVIILSFGLLIAPLALIKEFETFNNWMEALYDTVITLLFPEDEQ